MLHNAIMVWKKSRWIGGVCLSTDFISADLAQCWFTGLTFNHTWLPLNSLKVTIIVLQSPLVSFWKPIEAVCVPTCGF